MNSQTPHPNDGKSLGEVLFLGGRRPPYYPWDQRTEFFKEDKENQANAVAAEIRRRDGAELEKLKADYDSAMRRYGANRAEQRDKIIELEAEVERLKNWVENLKAQIESMKGITIEVTLIEAGDNAEEVPVLVFETTRDAIRGVRLPFYTPATITLAALAKEGDAK